MLHIVHFVLIKPVSINDHLINSAILLITTHEQKKKLILQYNMKDENNHTEV